MKINKNKFKEIDDELEKCKKLITKIDLLCKEAKEIILQNQSLLIHLKSLVNARSKCKITKKNDEEF